MKYCGVCGKAIADDDFFCSNCGHRLKLPIVDNQFPKYVESFEESRQQAKENIQRNTHFDTPQSNKEDELGIGAKWSLGIFALILFTAIIANLEAANVFIIILIGLSCLAAIFCVFKGIINKKYAWWIFAASVVGSFIMSSLSEPQDSSSSSDQEVEMQEVKKDEEARKKQEQKAEAERVAQEKQAEAMRIANEKAEKEAFVGRYIYKYYYHGTNIELYFVITLKSDGTFTHEPSNDQTRSIVEMETLVDGKDYPSGGKWKVKETPAGKAAFLDFGSSWGECSITPDQKVLEIDNMNGVRLKAQLLKN